MMTAALLLSVACSKAPEAPSSAPAGDQPEALGEPTTGDWIVRHMLSDPEQLNPLTSNDAGAATILGHIFETLTDRDPHTLALRPLLASELPTVSDDHLTYTFHLRKDARFSDGKPVTGEDVLFSIKAVKSPKVNAPFTRVYYASLVNAELIDPYTIRFTASEPYFRNESVLGGVSVLPRHYYDPEGHLDGISVSQVVEEDPAVADRVQAFADRFNRDFARNPMGSGPYRFTEWFTGERVVLDRNPDYWGNTVPEIERPWIDRMLFRVVNNTDAALVTLKGGDLDMLGLQPLQHLRETSGKKFTESFNKIEYYSPGYTYVGWNNESPLFSDVRVRRAMTHLIDREAMVKTILFDLGQVIHSPIYRFRPEYDESIQPLPFDPKQAVALLKEAGWADSDSDGILDKLIDGKRVPFSFELKINSGNQTRKSVALTMQDVMRRHGVEVKIRELDWTIFLDDIRARRYDAMVLGWAMGVTEPDAYQVWHSSQIDNRGSNHIAYRNNRVDELLTAYRKEFDPEVRIGMYREFQRILHDEQPYTFLFMGKNVVAYHRRFQNVEALPIGGVSPSRWWVPTDRQKYTTTPAATP